MKVGLLGGGNPHALAIARHFASLGIDCFGIGRGPKKPAPLWQVPKGYRYYQARVGEPSALNCLDHERPEWVISFCAQGEGAASFGESSWMFYQTNVVFLVQLVDELRKRQYLKRFIQIGSSEIYGSTSEPAQEDARPNPTSPYSVSKLCFDAHLEVMYRVHGFPMNIVRPSNCVTVGQQLHRIVPRAAICAVYGQKMQLQGGGLARKSYLDTEDLARGILTVLDKGTVGEIYNCGPQNPLAIRVIVGTVSALAGVEWSALVEETPARTGEDGCYWLDSAKLRTLGWKPEVPIDMALMRVIAWARAYPELAAMPWKYEVTP